MKCKWGGCKRTAKLHWAFCEAHIIMWMDGQHR